MQRKTINGGGWGGQKRTNMAAEQGRQGDAALSRLLLIMDLSKQLEQFV